MGHEDHSRVTILNVSGLNQLGYILSKLANDHTAWMNQTAEGALLHTLISK